MRIWDILSLFTSSVAVFAHPTAHPVSATETISNSTAHQIREGRLLYLRTSTPAPSHGLCKFTVKLIESLPRQSPTNVMLDLNMTEDKHYPLNKPTWSNGETIGKDQRLVMSSHSHGSLYLNDVIEPESELRIEFYMVIPKDYQISDAPDHLSFEYTRPRGGNNGAVVAFSDDRNDATGVARCKRRNQGLWSARYGPFNSPAGPNKIDRRERYVDCSFNC